MHCRVFQGVSGLYPLDVRGTPSCDNQKSRRTLSSDPRVKAPPPPAEIYCLEVALTGLVSGLDYREGAASKREATGLIPKFSSIMRQNNLKHSECLSSRPVGDSDAHCHSNTHAFYSEYHSPP